eukprot:167128-Chlamydomonas_euryale.AAC.11
MLAARHSAAHHAPSVQRVNLLCWVGGPEDIGVQADDIGVADITACDREAVVEHCHEVFQSLRHVAGGGVLWTEQRRVLCSARGLDVAGLDAHCARYAPQCPLPPCLVTLSGLRLPVAARGPRGSCAARKVRLLRPVVTLHRASATLDQREQREQQSAAVVAGVPGAVVPRVRGRRA